MALRFALSRARTRSRFFPMAAPLLKEPPTWAWRAASTPGISETDKRLTKANHRILYNLGSAESPRRDPVSRPCSCATGAHIPGKTPAECHSDYHGTTSLAAEPGRFHTLHEPPGGGSARRGS